MDYGKLDVVVDYFYETFNTSFFSEKAVEKVIYWQCHLVKKYKIKPRLFSKIDEVSFFKMIITIL